MKISGIAADFVRQFGYPITVPQWDGDSISGATILFPDGSRLACGSWQAAEAALDYFFTSGKVPKMGFAAEAKYEPM